MRVRLGALTPAVGAAGFVVLWWLVYRTAWIDPVPFPLEATLIDALIAVRGGACPGASEAERSETPRVRYPRAYFRAALSNAAKRVRETPEGSRHRVL